MKQRIAPKFEIKATCGTDTAFGYDEYIDEVCIESLKVNAYASKSIPAKRNIAQFYDYNHYGKLEAIYKALPPTWSN